MGVCRKKIYKGTHFSNGSTTSSRHSKNASILGPENFLIALLVDLAIENLDATPEGVTPALNS